MRCVGCCSSWPTLVNCLSIIDCTLCTIVPVGWIFESKEKTVVFIEARLIGGMLQLAWPSTQLNTVFPSWLMVTLEKQLWFPHLQVKTRRRTAEMKSPFLMGSQHLWQVYGIYRSKPFIKPTIGLRMMEFFVNGFQKLGFRYSMPSPGHCWPECFENHLHQNFQTMFQKAR